MRHQLPVLLAASGLATAFPALGQDFPVTIEHIAAAEGDPATPVEGALLQ